MRKRDKISSSAAGLSAVGIVLAAMGYKTIEYRITALSLSIPIQPPVH